jgi:hypothetical protein
MPNDPPNPEQDFPVAQVSDTPEPAQVGAVIVSRLWLVTLVCLIGAVGLVVWQSRSAGPLIEIHFGEGHGLQPGDAVRFRGIDVGKVKDVQLSPTLDGVAVVVELTAASAKLAREGTRFWIERPDISVGQVRGLDTIVGGRYVGVLPGPEEAPSSYVFYGMDVASPMVDNIADGLEIALESAHRQGLQNGSPVVYRGVTVGHIMSVGLAGDAVTVEARAFIQPNYRELVRENTKFWSNSGLDLKIGFSGLELDAETLATIASGGVAFATPNAPGQQAATGYRFELFKSPRDEWVAWQPRIAIGSSALPAGVPLPRPLPGVRRETGALSAITGSRERGWLLSLDDGRLLGPANVLSQAEDQKCVLEVAGQEAPLPLDGVEVIEGIAVGKLQLAGQSGVVAWSRKRIRAASEIEEIVITCGSDETTLPLAAARLTAAEDRWVVDPSVPLDDGWHGACVVAASDGLVIGVLLREEGRSVVVPLGEKALEAIGIRPPQLKRT